MNEKYRAIIRQKIIDMQAQALPELTRRELWQPSLPNKALAIIGIRRAGKTTAKSHGIKWSVCVMCWYMIT